MRGLDAAPDCLARRNGGAQHAGVLLGGSTWLAAYHAVRIGMAHSSLYDDDIVLWSEAQAQIIRRLGQSRRDLPNDLDIENVAEEIESAGRSETASVESYLRLLMLHLIKIAAAPHAPAVSHWRNESLNFGADASIRFAPSMAQRIDIERPWRTACRQARTALAEPGEPAPSLPTRCPWPIEELVREELNLDGLVSALLEAKSGPASA
jgi:hypothetical protein